MQNLTTLKDLQTSYQTKFARLLQLQESGLAGDDTTESPEYIEAKEEWLKASKDLQAYLEQQNKV